MNKTISTEDYSETQILSFLKEKGLKRINIGNNMSSNSYGEIDAYLLNNPTTTIAIYPNEELNVSVINNFKNIKNLVIHSNYENSLENLDDLKKLNGIIELSLSSDATKETLSFKPISDITTLTRFEFRRGLKSKAQYTFLNKQKELQFLTVNKLDIDLVSENLKLKELRINSTIKNAHIIKEKFPNLEKIHLHGCSRLDNHTFLGDLCSLNQIYIGYNSHLKELPFLKQPELIKSIELYNCPNFKSVESILQFDNLERFVITSYDKPLKLPIDDFEKLKELKKLKVVYSQWGKRPKKDLDFIKNIYNRTKWINSGL